MSKELILKQIKELQKQLEELEVIEKNNDFIRLLREVLLNDKCTIILQGHNERQSNEKYLMKDIAFEYRHAIAKALQEIIKPKQQIKVLENPPKQQPTKATREPVFIGDDVDTKDKKK